MTRVELDSILSGQQEIYEETVYRAEQEAIQEVLSNFSGDNSQWETAGKLMDLMEKWKVPTPPWWTRPGSQPMKDL